MCMAPCASPTSCSSGTPPRLRAVAAASSGLAPGADASRGWGRVRRSHWPRSAGDLFGAFVVAGHVMDDDMEPTWGRQWARARYASISSSFWPLMVMVSAREVVRHVRSFRLSTSGEGRGTAETATAQLVTYKLLTANISAMGTTKKYVGQSARPSSGSGVDFAAKSTHATGARLERVRSQPTRGGTACAPSSRRARFARRIWRVSCSSPRPPSAAT